MTGSRFLTSAVLLAMLAGCGGAAAPASSTAPSGSAAASAAAAKSGALTKLTVGTPSAAAPSAIVPLTKDAGLYRKYGLDANVQVFQGAKNLLASMFSGEVPITYQGSPEVINAALNNADIVMFAGIINTIFFSVYTRPDITDPQQLKGKKIGYTFSGNDEAGAKVALAHYGLQIPRDMTPVNMPGGQADRIAALQSGAVDAISIAPPFTYQANKAGLHDLVNDSDLNVEFQSGTFATSRAYLRDHRDVVVRFTKAISEGLHYMKTNKDASMKSLGVYTKTTDQDLLSQSYDDFAHKYVVKVPNLTIPGLQYVMDNLITDPNVKSHKPQDFIDTSVVKELTDQGFYKQLWGDDTAGV